MSGYSDNLKGAIFMMVSMLAFLINDTLIKEMSHELPLMQAIALRGMGTTAILLVAGLATGGLRVRIEGRDWVRIIARGVAEAVSAGLYIAALFHLPIANATAILQALPLTVTLASWLFLGEQVGWRRLSAILVGFIGVLLIVRPGPDGFNIYAVLAFVSVLTVTARDLVTRKLGARVPSMIVATVTAGIVTVFGLAGSVIEGWKPVGTVTAVELLCTVLAIIMGYIFAIKAMRVGEIAAVTPFRYTSLVFALISGFVVFHEWPDAITLIGAAIVVATGLFTLYRERGQAKAKAPGPVPLRIR